MKGRQRGAGANPTGRSRHARGRLDRRSREIPRRGREFRPGVVNGLRPPVGDRLSFDRRSCGNQPLKSGLMPWRTFFGSPIAQSCGIAPARRPFDRIPSMMCIGPACEAHGPGGGQRAVWSRANKTKPSGRDPRSERLERIDCHVQQARQASGLDRPIHPSRPTAGAGIPTVAWTMEIIG